MEQYDFHDLKANERGDPAFLPPEALFIIQDWIGVPIENMIDGYQTLNVTGRELFARSINSESNTSLEGAIFKSANYPSREIEIAYQLKANSDQEFREKYQKLNLILSNPQFKFYFFDDVQYFWTGTVSSADKVEPGRNWVKGSFTINCSSPFKRLIEATIYHGIGNIRINEPIDFPTVPDSIELIVSKDSTTQIISNGKQSINLSGNFKKADKLVIEPEKSVITLNGNNALSMLNLDSDFENFRVITGTTVYADGELTVKVRRLAL